MIFRLDERLLFPNPALAEDDGLLAVGGDLSTQRLLLAYHNGIFPWYSEGEPILWYSPHERFVLYPQQLKISKSMHRILRSGVFTVTMDTCFNEVVSACSSVQRNGQDGTWITPDMKAAYLNLHLQGHANSIEVWQGGSLVGGLYGVAAGNIFCGESMFSLVNNASKTALIWLCNTGRYQLIDCQVYTEHLESMGAGMVSRKEYMAMLPKTIA
ncbi:leucyl/phenylalanyl-tRNA--protein transferase [Mucilaginibacter phyllosphaerae]|uniref:Leucyl/phenylalanyl-tRNA--protein transferase n=1 Tax=Mucilaginibacter phyllosphaerae TaxID=1812349 RepID=A0A4Y8ADS3_9SPHI|nr:leucyl/phenylalanyl-tRNA--protein transferase [Mucilaginibacter phyllosphaerae]MBB3970384.1 leucyl/phenylalanyl-tRNA--protein transferase [Mucilaginibacter phyllosphaerae]TEW66750.1 leucyl/phenylalanyl-tRNA--protein transferase [Mucilaginibacter phyllosphaerae]GGH11679.1 leucyl/phenylalanyl-tRNA--protein transferase [Mucilaginibacter phyllosphaerae]